MYLPPQQVLKFVNLARQYPKYFVNLLEEQLQAFVDEQNIQLADDVLYETIEGRSVWQEAKSFLIAQEPVRPLDFSQGLTQAANDHCLDIASHGINGHTGSDGSTFIDRVQCHCGKGKGSMIELIGSTHTLQGKNPIELALVNLIVDDGVPNRGHRRALFSRDYKHVGISFREEEEKIVSVLAMTQFPLDTLTKTPQSIATSTSHLKTYTQLSQAKEQDSKENYPSTPSRDQDVWTLNKVEGATTNSKPKTSEVEPSIFKEVNNSKQSIASHQSPKASKTSLHQDVPQKQQSSRRLIKQIKSKGSIKDSVISPTVTSPKQLDRSIKSNSNSQDAFGTSSDVEKYKIKSTLNPFKRGSQLSNIDGKKVVEKREMMRSWCEDEYLVKQVTTVVRFEDGSVEDWVEKHSVLKSVESTLKGQSV